MRPTSAIQQSTTDSSSTEQDTDGLKEEDNSSNSALNQILSSLEQLDANPVVDTIDNILGTTVFGTFVTTTEKKVFSDADQIKNNISEDVDDTSVDGIQKGSEAFSTFFQETTNNVLDDSKYYSDLTDEQNLETSTAFNLDINPNGTVYNTTLITLDDKTTTPILLNENEGFSTLSETIFSTSTSSEINPLDDLDYVGDIEFSLADTPTPNILIAMESTSKENSDDLITADGYTSESATSVTGINEGQATPETFRPFDSEDSLGHTTVLTPASSESPQGSFANVDTGSKEAGKLTTSSIYEEHVWGLSDNYSQLSPNPFLEAGENHETTDETTLDRKDTIFITQDFQTCHLHNFFF